MRGVIGGGIESGYLNMNIIDDKSVVSKHSYQKDVVRVSVVNRFDHPTAESVYLSARAICPKISLATVYRNLDRLVNEREIKRLTVPGSPDHFDPVRKEHYHVLCICCGKLFDVEFKIRREFSKLIGRQTGVTMQSIQLIAKGLCVKCAKNKDIRYNKNNKRRFL